MSTWLLDLGNTRLKLAPLLDGGTVGPVTAVDHADPAWPDRLLDVLPSCDVVHLSSVASELLRVLLLDTLLRRTSRVCLARTQARFSGLTVAYAEPGKLGVDRFLAMLGARRQVNDAVLVCGVGTALTVDLIDSEGRHRGGRIAPSPTLMRESLHARAPQLPKDGGAYCDFATDTADGLASGCEGAALGLIAESLQQAKTLLGTTPALLLHGGGAEPLRARAPDATFVPNLVLHGLAVWATLDRAA